MHGPVFFSQFKNDRNHTKNDCCFFTASDNQGLLPKTVQLKFRRKIHSYGSNYTIYKKLVATVHIVYYTFTCLHMSIFYVHGVLYKTYNTQTWTAHAAIPFPPVYYGGGGGGGGVGGGGGRMLRM